MHGVCIIIIDQESRILLQKRIDTGLWSTIGRAMELGESFEETAHRELMEETGLKIEKMELKTILSGKEMFYQYPNGDKVYNVIALFEILKWNGELKINDDESLDFAFFSFDEAKEKLHPFSLLILEKAGYYD